MRNEVISMTPVLFFTESGGGPDTVILSVVDMDDEESCGIAHRCRAEIERKP